MYSCEWDEDQVKVFTVTKYILHLIYIPQYTIHFVNSKKINLFLLETKLK